MENIICIVLLSLSFIIFKIIFKINIKKAKAIQENKELEMLTNKFDKNYDIAKDMLDILKNDTVKIEEAKDTKTSLYIWATNKIIIADMKNNYARLQTIAHECVHSCQDKLLLGFNFVFSNIYILYYIIAIILTICKVFTNSLLQLFILMLLSLIYFSVRSFLEIDAMTKSRFLAEKYIDTKNILADNEKKKLLSEYDKINKMGIPFTIDNLLSRNNHKNIYLYNYCNNNDLGKGRNLKMEEQKYIRNFCIIAHIDHGKSTLADRLIEKTGLLSQREMESQVLDNMDLEKERGITIKAQAVRMEYKAKDGNKYILNLIDTPGHVDFNYEVSRSLAACEGAILVVDSSQGVEAQTLANVYLAIDNGLEILPVINKVDLPNARPEEVKKEIEEIIGIPAENAPCISAKSGLNIEEVLERIVTDFNPPKGDINKPLKSLIFDSIYDNYKGAVSYVRVVEGSIKVGDEILFMGANKKSVVTELGYLEPGRYSPAEMLVAGEVGYISASIKNISDLHVGDTITKVAEPAVNALPGYKKANPMVYCGLYPLDR